MSDIDAHVETLEDAISTYVADVCPIGHGWERTEAQVAAYVNEWRVALTELAGIARDKEEYAEIARGERKAAQAAEQDRDRLNRENNDLNAENRDLLEKWSERGGERDRLKAENSEYHDQAIRDYQQINRLKAALRQDNYQRLWHRDAGRARVFLVALEAIDAVRIPSDGAKDAAERAYFDTKTITAAALRPGETPSVALEGVPAAIQVQEAMVAHERAVAEFDAALADVGGTEENTG